MIPASFASMILKFVLPEVREILVPLFKYKDEPNSADIIGEKNQEHITMIAGEISGLDDRLKKLETMSNKPKKVK